MTQLPESEVLRRDLEREVVGKRFKDVTVKTAGIVAPHRNRPDFVKSLEGRKVEDVSRRGAAVVLGLEGNTALVIRAGARASLTRETANAEPHPDTQVIATFTTGGSLHYRDPGGDGRLYVVDRDALDDLDPGGVDPLADTFTWHTLAGQLQQRAAPLKDVLVDESFIVGLGDLYADEILYAAGLSGRRATPTLANQELRRLYRAILEVVHEAVKQRGTAQVGDTTRTDLLGRPGTYDERLQVHGRAGEPCQRCRQAIRREPYDDGRESYFCPQCQT